MRSKDDMAADARECRRGAPEFAGQPEEPIFLHLGSEFERLASQARAKKQHRLPAL
jgi:hypothetical protein